VRFFFYFNGCWPSSSALLASVFAGAACGGTAHQPPRYNRSGGPGPPPDSNNRSLRLMAYLVSGWPRALEEYVLEIKIWRYFQTEEKLEK